MRVLCVGLESSGTRLLTRLVDSLGVEAVHQSVPHSKQWWKREKNINRVIVIVRDFADTESSAKRARHYRHWTGREATFPYRLTFGFPMMINKVTQMKVPWTIVTYESLLDDPQLSLNNIADWLDLPHAKVPEEVERKHKRA